MSCRVAIMPVVVPCQRIVFVEDVVMGFMRHAHDRGVKSFPKFTDESWHLLLRATQDSVPHLIPTSIFLKFDPPEDRGDRYPMLKGYKKIEEALAVLAPVDRKTGRMRFRMESPFGFEMIESFRGLVEAMYVIGCRIDGFYELK